MALRPRQLARRIIDGRRIRWRSAFVALAAMSLSLGISGLDAAAQELPPGYELGIFEYAISEVPQITAPGVVGPDGGVLIPLTIVLDQARIPHERDTTGVLVRLIDAERTPVRGAVRPIRRLVERGDSAVVADSTHLLAAGGEVFLSAALLGFLLDADVDVDFGALLVRIRPRVPFPAHLATEAERRRRLAEIRMGMEIERLPGAPLRAISGAGVLRYAVSAGTPEPLDNAVATLESGIALLGGQAVVGFTGTASDDDLPGPALTARFERFVPESPWLSFVRAGDVTAEAGLARSIRGLTFTNRPLRRGQRFQDVAIVPEIPPGWEVEVYRNGQLVGFTDPAAPGSVTVPVSYGRTELDVRMIGPAGEIVRSELLYSIPETLLPQGRLEYTAGGGDCLIADCALVFADADVGVTPWLTVGSGYQAEWDSTGVSHHPTLSGIVVRPGGWLAESRFVAGRLLSATALYSGAGPFTGSAGFDLTAPEVGRASLLPLTDSRWSARGDIGRAGHRLLGRISGPSAGGVDGWSATALSGIGRTIGSVQIEDYPLRPPVTTLAAFRSLGSRWFDGRYTANLRLSFEGDGFSLLELGLGGVWLQTLAASASLQWQEPYGPALNLSFTRQFDVGQVAGFLSGGEESEFRSSLRADGAVAVDPFRAVEPASYRGVGFAGVDVLAFHDLNGNGIRDAGEPPAENVVVQVGGETATTDATGHGRAWGLVPYEKLPIRIAPAWADPRWTPRDSLLVLRPVPHVFNPVELPLVGTREVLASVVAGPGVPTSSGIGFTLTNRTTGQVFRGMTLSDGAIYLSQVPVGTYTLEFSRASLDAVQARVVGAPLVVDVVTDDPEAFVVDLPPILLEPLTPPPADPADQSGANT
ncbi:MAG TPA: hypothetical protein VF039_11590 [Longimicrobiales bacterium]